MTSPTGALQQRGYVRKVRAIYALYLTAGYGILLALLVLLLRQV